MFAHAQVLPQLKHLYQVPDISHQVYSIVGNTICRPSCPRWKALSFGISYIGSTLNGGKWGHHRDLKHWRLKLWHIWVTINKMSGCEIGWCDERIGLRHFQGTPMNNLNLEASQLLDGARNFGVSVPANFPKQDFCDATNVFVWRAKGFEVNQPSNEPFLRVRP